MSGFTQTTPHEIDGHTVEIRMLGPLQVRRGDGSTVDPQAWRTGKTADLLRMLALRAGQPVPTDGLLTALWPNSDLRRGQASLRTAVSQIRQILGRDYLERGLTGLRLCDAWVDVVAFRTLAAQARRLMCTGDLDRVETVAREADGLYLGNLRAHDDGADWAQTERRSLAGAHQVLLCDAADATLARGAAPDAIDFASRAIEVDPFSERASRVLMRGYADLGDTSLALREYERCRLLLAEELGVDPSPQTRALHLELLRSESPIQTADSDPPYRHPEQVVQAGNDGVLRVSTPVAQAESRLQLALTVCLPHRQFVRARRCAEEAASLTDQPAIQVRAIVASCLPDLLLGRASAAYLPLEEAARLADDCDDHLVRRRLDVLRCLVAHDLARPDFEVHWASAAARCEVETDVNWAWLMIRIATERGDLVSARLANQLPVPPAAGPLARKLHAMASAALLAELGDTAEAIERLRGVVDAEDCIGSVLLLPEALARLAMLLADTDIAAAQACLARLDLVLGIEPGLPREACLRLMASATVHSAQGRPAAAAAAAASAAAVADHNGLRFLAAGAHEMCAGQTALAARGAPRGPLNLALTLTAVGS
jgi:DNA-binding SARP family transcriptional activator